MNTKVSIEQTFYVVRSQGRAALMPYFTIGYPDIDTSIAIIQAMAASGADLIELGIPFSDPLADGPTIQQSTQIALRSGVTLEICLHTLQRLRQSGVSTPLLLMGYYNPIISFGEERFAKLAAEGGAQGIIIPDLPPEESEDLRLSCNQVGLSLIHLVAPTTPLQRIRFIAEKSQGFIYVVSVTGVTGARQSLPQDLIDFIRSVRSVSALPLALGFGISTPQQAATYGRYVDGVIVGSALIEKVRQSDRPVRAAAEFVRSFRLAMENGCSN
ncbi:MAG: tryptophan synthase subunit alpha [Anaerolineales bacterium]